MNCPSPPPASAVAVAAAAETISLDAASAVSRAFEASDRITAATARTDAAEERVAGADVVDAAMDFVIALQSEHGDIDWAVGAYARTLAELGVTAVHDPGPLDDAIGRALGHPVRIFMPDWMSQERVKILQAFGVTLLGGTPTFLEAMVREASPGQLDSLRLCVTGGEACPFTTFYWEFLGRNYDRIKDNRRMTFQVKNYDRKNSGQLAAISRRAGELRKAWSR